MLAWMKQIFFRRDTKRRRAEAAEYRTPANIGLDYRFYHTRDLLQDITPMLLWCGKMDMQVTLSWARPGSGMVFFEFADAGDAIMFKLHWIDSIKDKLVASA